MGVLKIEKIGGLAGYGMSGSKLRSNGEQALSALSAGDRASVETLFSNPHGLPGSGQERDGFRYRITRTANGEDQTIEVPESAVPSALKACVSDKLT
jgi:hypothetical protein